MEQNKEKRTINVERFENKTFLTLELSSELRNYYDSTYGKLIVQKDKIVREKVKIKK